MMNETEGEVKKCCACPHHKAIPVFIVGIGLLFLLKAIDVLDEQVLNIGWPLLVIAAGVTKLSKSMCKCC